MLGVRFVSRASHIKRLAEKKALSHDLNHVWKPLSLLPIHPNHVWKLLKPMGVMITLRRRRLGGLRVYSVQKLLQVGKHVGNSAFYLYFHAH
jgi:hypothetical protein